MKAWSRLTWLIPAVLLLVLLVLNVVLLQLRDETIPDEALVDINRMARELENGTPMHELDQTDIQVALIDMKKTSIETYGSFQNQSCASSSEQGGQLLPLYLSGTAHTIRNLLDYKYHPAWCHPVCYLSSILYPQADYTALS